MSWYNYTPPTWSSTELKIIKTLSTPYKIQQFLNSIEYSAESRYRCPRTVLKDKKAHCFDGAVFAAAMLRQIGFPPLIVDMQSVRDDDHVIAIFKKNNRFGAIAKSNFTGLRFREPVYLTLRELVMSYFESFYNMDKEKTLRQYTRAVKLSLYDNKNWMFEDEPMEEIGLQLSYVKIYKLFTEKMIRAFHPVDDRTFKAGMLGANKKGIYNPSKKKIQ